MKHQFTSLYSATAVVAQWSECSPSCREVAGSGPVRVIPKALKMVLVVSSIDAQHEKGKTGTGCDPVSGQCGWVVHS